MAFITIYDKTGHPWQIADKWWSKYEAEGYTLDNPAIQSAHSTTATAGPVPSTNPTLPTAVVEEIRRKAWANEPLDSPTPEKQAIWNEERKKALEEINRKAQLGVPVDDQANQQTWMAILAQMGQQQDTGLLGGVGAGIKNVTGAHPGMALAAGALLLFALMRR